MADRIAQFGAIERVEVELAHPARVEAAAQFGGDCRAESCPDSDDRATGIGGDIDSWFCIQDGPDHSGNVVVQYGAQGAQADVWWIQNRHG